MKWRVFCVRFFAEKQLRKHVPLNRQRQIFDVGFANFGKWSQGIFACSTLQIDVTLRYKNFILRIVDNRNSRWSLYNIYRLSAFIGGEEIFRPIDFAGFSTQEENTNFWNT